MRPNPILDPKFGLSRIGLALSIKKQVQSGWSQIGFKFGFYTIMYLIKPNETDLNPILGRVGPPGPGPNLGHTIFKQSPTVKLRW